MRTYLFSQLLHKKTERSIGKPTYWPTLTYTRYISLNYMTVKENNVKKYFKGFSYNRKKK